MRLGLKVFLAVISATVNVSCIDMPEPKDDNVQILSTVGKFEHATSASNLLTTAIRQELDVDIVFYPSEGLADNAYAEVSPDMQPALVKRRLIKLYSGGVWDRIVTGTLRGRDIKNFVVNRTMETGRHDLHVDGIKYSVRLEGGLPAVYQLKMFDDSEFDERKSYRVAVSRHALSGIFPGYRFRHNFNFGFQNEKQKSESIEDILTNYLERIDRLGLYTELRSIVEVTDRGELPGITSISEIKGVSFISPLKAKRVVTEGVVTALGEQEVNGLEFYLQSESPDGDNRSSEAILVRLGKSDVKVQLGAKLRVAASVEEELAGNGLSRTILTRVTDVEAIDTSGISLPKAVVLGSSDIDEQFRRKVPNRFVSTYRGNLNQKQSLNLNDGIDFWESLEGMRVILKRPRVVGVSGGQKDAMQVKRYINLFVVADGTESEDTLTAKGGMRVAPELGDYNPEIVKIVDHHFSSVVNPEYTYEVGDRFDFDLEGIVAFEINAFGGGEYVFYVTGRFEEGSKIKGLAERPRTKLNPEAGKLTVATYNVENLSDRERSRIEKIGESIAVNLACPDIISFIEVQDYNGESFEGSADAQPTLDSIIKKIDGCEFPVDYKSVNINPVQNQEGGEPGGNIRVAMLYNSLRVGYEPRGNPSALEETYILEDGRLSTNPGRVFPNDPVFERTRKSLIVEFEFESEPVYVIGNHLNSKLGDTDVWDAQQPPVFGSELKRAQMTNRINDFVSLLMKTKPDAKVVVVGDFNDYDVSQALQVMEGRVLKNLMNVETTDGELLVPKDRRYTYSYRGNSQPIDFILASYPLLSMQPEMEVIHVNSDYMGQIADHDPLIARFDFFTKN